MGRKNNAMAKVDLLFSLILLWGIVSTTLLVRQHNTNTELQRQILADRRKQKYLEKTEPNKFHKRYQDAKNFMGGGPNEITKHHSRKVANVHPFPFTRSIDTVKRSKGFFLYVAHGSDGGTTSDVSPSSPLSWSEVSWKDLVVNWGRDTAFNDLLQMSTHLKPPHRGEMVSVDKTMQKKLVLHCLPKAASTTLRRACYKNMKENCEAIEFPTQQDPYGYRNVTEFFRAVKECKEINHFCVQGGDAEMSIINYEGNEDDTRAPLHFIHMVPFRKFDDWVGSAIKQIHVIDGEGCIRIDKLLDQCLGYRELYMELYPKSVLSLLTGMAFDANSGHDRDSIQQGKDKHHILLYNYQHVDDIVTSVSDFFGITPLPHTWRRHKEQRNEGTCPDAISEKFHKCHDETLISADAVRDLKAEKKRRRNNDRGMKTILMCLKDPDCNIDEDERVQRAMGRVVDEEIRRTRA